MISLPSHLRSPVPSPLRGGLGRGCAGGTRRAGIPHSDYRPALGRLRVARARLLPSPSRGGEQRARGGFTLLEVILALVILGAGLAMLGEVTQLASRHAVDARAETQAQSLAESVMDQIVAGAIEKENVSRQPLEVDDTTPWLYSITVGTSNVVGIEPVEVLVEQDLEDRFNPARFRLLRWTPTLAELPESASGGGAMGGSGSGGGQSGGQSGGSAGGGSSPGGAGGQMP
jgi:prepilin-type N-terminal cleavage/methylation domain-containing protein